MRIVLDNGMVSPEINVGDVVNKRFAGHVTAAAVDRSEIIFFMAKGGIWAEYARYFRELMFKNKTQEIFINEDK